MIIYIINDKFDDYTNENKTKHRINQCIMFYTIKRTSKKNIIIVNLSKYEKYKKYKKCKKIYIYIYILYIYILLHYIKMKYNNTIIEL